MGRPLGHSIERLRFVLILTFLPAMPPERAGTGTRHQVQNRSPPALRLAERNPADLGRRAKAAR